MHTSRYKQYSNPRGATRSQKTWSGPTRICEREQRRQCSEQRVDRDLQGNEAEYAIMVEKQGQGK